ncbi:glycosyltransferase family protein [Rhodobacter ferrooxidans]|uniref:Glycosyl transferase group 1 n=1 Tax=Rhodobacter ferrooxidans TaxID=371731 RepID=C8RWW3_9RHOB|nr:hypothetical protein [Rhodobacter sp. SW2]EEW27056.1 hypothetical protein Rsw2DRAFT_0291 [Rhodobacter sp. SW2]
MPSRITIVAPLPAPRRRQRLAKLVRGFQKSGFGVDFMGWDRIKGEAAQWRWQGVPIREKIILTGGGHNSKSARAMYPLWIIVVFFRVLALGRGQTLYCLGWESAFPACLAAKLTRSKVIFDDADRFSMVLGLSGFLNRVLKSLELYTSRKVDLHIVPGFSRYEWRNENMFELKNSPSRADLDEGFALAGKRVSADIVLYVNGWLVETRGALVLLALLQELRRNGVKACMHVAGFLPDKLLQCYLSDPDVIYHGELPQAKALSLYLESDIALTFYDPAVPINRMAESNKWGDCVFYRKPFVVNSEVETADRFVKAGAAWSVPYGDVGALTDLVVRLVREPELIANAQENLASFDDQFPVFDVQVDRLCERIAEIGRQTRA